MNSKAKVLQIYVKETRVSLCGLSQVLHVLYFEVHVVVLELTH